MAILPINTLGKMTSQLKPLQKVFKRYQEAKFFFRRLPKAFISGKNEVHDRGLKHENHD